MKKILIFVLVILMVLLIYLMNSDKKTYYLALGNSNKYVLENSKMIKGYSFYVWDYLKEKGKLEKYVYEFSKADTRIPDLINMINNNEKYKDITLKNALIKADLVTLNINIDDIYEKLKDENIIYGEIYDYIDDMIIDLEKLFGLLRKYCKEEIIFIGVYKASDDSNSNIDDIIYYLNEKYKSSCKKYNIEYVDLSQKLLNEAIFKTIGQEVIKTYS